MNPHVKFTAKQDGSFSEFVKREISDTKLLEKMLSLEKKDLEIMKQASDQGILEYEISDDNRTVIQRWKKYSDIFSFRDRHNDDPDGEFYRTMLEKYWHRHLPM
jgi:hypothetical protein